MTPFEKVARYNRLIGNERDQGLGTQSVKTQVALIEEELTELRHGVESRNRREVRDGIADVLVVVYGLAHILGIDADKDFNEVMDSNFSKFCTTREELTETVEYYKSISVLTGTRGDLPELAVVSRSSQVGDDGKYYPEGKQLKCTNWKEPEFN